MSQDRHAGVLLAFDFGLRRVGIATGNLHTCTASPLATLEVGRELPWTRIDAIVDEWRPARLVVGVPEESRGATDITGRARAFAEALGQRYALPVETVDESFTSAAAAAEVRESRRSGALSRRAGKGSLDRRAACLIAEQWMSEAGHER